MFNKLVDIICEYVEVEPENVKPAEPLTPAQPAQSETVEAQPPAPTENQVQPPAAE